MEDIIWDVAVIGAGAAGLMTALTCREGGLQVLLLDGKEKIGAKILMSGGTRCNLTNLVVTEKDFSSETPRNVRNVLRVFPSMAAVEFFKKLGVEVIAEEAGKFFPVTHSAKTVLQAFLNEVERTGVCLRKSCKVREIQPREHGFLVCGSNFRYTARTVVLCTGGLSYPSTGSDGIGYQMAEALGHHLVFTTPSLTPLETDDPDWKSLMGVSMPVRVSLWVGEKKMVTEVGSFLFTHFGFSGPVVLNISRHWIRYRKTFPSDDSAKLMACFLPMENEDSFRQILLSTATKHPTHFLKHFLRERLPERFVAILLKKIGLSDSLVLNQLTREDRERLIHSVFYFPLPVVREVGYLKAEVTAGGIDLGEVDDRTLESKFQPGFFFAGEILDVDGRIGGFNFQWAWSSGVVAGRGVIERLCKNEKTSS